MIRGWLDRGSNIQVWAKRKTHPLTGLGGRDAQKPQPALVCLRKHWKTMWLGYNRTISSPPPQYTHVTQLTWTKVASSPERRRESRYLAWGNRLMTTTEDRETVFPENYSRHIPPPAKAPTVSRDQQQKTDATSRQANRNLKYKMNTQLSIPKPWERGTKFYT